MLRTSAQRGTNACAFFFCSVVVLSNYPIRGMGSIFYFRNAHWPNLQQHLWAWVFTEACRSILLVGAQRSRQPCSAPLLLAWQHSTLRPGERCGNAIPVPLPSLTGLMVWPLLSRRYRLGLSSPFCKRWTSTFSNRRCWQSRNIISKSSEHSFF